MQVLLQAQQDHSPSEPADALSVRLVAGPRGLEASGSTVLCALQTRPTPLGQGCESAQGAVMCIAAARCEQQDAVTVATLTELCKRNTIAFETRQLAMEDLLAAGELFVADSALGVLPASLVRSRLLQ